MEHNHKSLLAHNYKYGFTEWFWIAHESVVSWHVAWGLANVGLTFPGVIWLSSRWTLTISRLIWASPSVEPKVQKRIEVQQASWDLDSELAQYHFTCIPLTKRVKRPNQILGIGNQILPFDERTCLVTLQKTLQEWCHLWNLLHCPIGAWNYKFNGQVFFPNGKRKIYCGSVENILNHKFQSHI